jgi:hypothetical protein
MRGFLHIVIISGIIFSCSGSNEDQKLVSVSSKVTTLSSPAGDSSAQPYLFTDSAGIVHLSWIEKIGKQSTLKFSSLINDKWSSPSTIASGNNWFVNWADYPVISTDGDKHYVAHYLEKSDTAKFTYDVKISVSSDSGKTWSTPKTLHDDGKKAEHGFVSIIPYKDQFFVTWLDGRKTANGESHDNHSGHQGEMTLRAAFIAKNGHKTKEWELDERICDCCQTTAAITTDGPIVVYRDRSGNEIRDMSIVRFLGGEWTSPKAVYADNWQIRACPVNGPKADAINNDLAIAWFTMKDQKGQVKVVFSSDNGENFGKVIQIGEGKAIGRIDLVMIDSSSAIVSWMEGSSVKKVTVRSDGSKEPSVMIASSSDKRSSGFPQMTKAGDKIYFAWTDDKAKTIRVASINLSD